VAAHPPAGHPPAGHPPAGHRPAADPPPGPWASAVGAAIGGRASPAALGVLALAALLLAALSVAVLTLPVAVQLGLVAGAVAVTVFFTRPAFALVAFLLGRVLIDLLWWLPGSVGSLNLMELYTGGVSGLALILLALDLRRHETNPCLPAFMPYVAVLAIGGVRNLELRSAAEILARYLSPLLVMFLVAGYLDTRERRRQALLALSICFAVPVSISIFKLLGGQMNSYVLAGYQRLNGGYKNLHSHALMMLVISSFWMWQGLMAHLDGKRRERALVGAGLAGSLVALYFTYVRTGQLALVVLTAFFLFVTGRRRLLVAGALAGVVLVSMSDTVQDRFKDLVLFVLPDDNVMERRKLGSGRLTIWTAAIQAYLQAPLADILMGLGIGKHWLLTRGAFNPYSMASDGYVDPHSDYLTMTFQVGPIATISYVIMQIQVVRIGLQVHRHSPDRRAAEFGAFTAALCVGATVANFVSNSFINRVTPAWVLWSFAGITFAEHQQLVREGLIRTTPPPVTSWARALRPGGPPA